MMLAIIRKIVINTRKSFRKHGIEYLRKQIAALRGTQNLTVKVHIISISAFRAPLACE